MKYAQMAINVVCFFAGLVASLMGVLWAFAFFMDWPNNSWAWLALGITGPCMAWDSAISFDRIRKGRT